MTRPFCQRMECPSCRTEVTIETALGRWLRGQPRLRSEDGINIYDADGSIERRLVHRYKDGTSREVQCFMEVEVKQYGASPTPAQTSTLQILSDYLKNTIKNVNSSRGASGDRSGKWRQIHDRQFNRWIWVRHYGIHLLQFEKSGPEDSSWIRWDGVDITGDQLVGLFAFDLHPYSLRPLSARDRHARVRRPLLDLLAGREPLDGR
jgi:hypothetical protein